MNNHVTEAFWENVSLPARRLREKELKDKILASFRGAIACLRHENDEVVGKSFEFDVAYFVKTHPGTDEWSVSTVLADLTLEDLPGKGYSFHIDKVSIKVVAEDV